jgi:cytochrome c peroxidase
MSKGVALLFASVLATLASRAHASEEEPVPAAYRPLAPRGYADWTSTKAALGRKLFRDPLLSGQKSVSCSSCHDAARAFADGQPLSRGSAGRLGARNTPTIVNRGLGAAQFWDGRAPTLEAQALGPIASPLEMDLPVAEAVTRLDADGGYRDWFRLAFARPISPETLAEALAAYERTVFSVDSPFDRFIAGDTRALAPAALRGLRLFGGKGRCGTCHAGINFSDEAFHVLGLGEDPGRAVVTSDPLDRGAFKTPTLREVARTAPYMHDGSLHTMREVVDFYDQGGRPHPNLDPALHPLGLSEGEKGDLVAFLSSLSGTVIEGVPAPAMRVAARKK